MAVSQINNASLASPLTAATITTGTITTLNAPSGVLATQNGMTGIAKAWVNFNGGNGNTAGVIRASFNVSSITVNGTGNYTINFTTAMPNTNYAGVASIQRAGLTDWVNIGFARTTTTDQLETFSGTTQTNMVIVQVAYFSS